MAVTFVVNDSVVPTGVSATGSVGTVRIVGWTVINDAQTPNWTQINDAQVPNWEEIDVAA